MGLLCDIEGECVALFLSTTINRLDKKGRVSVPAAFRLAASTPEFQGIVLAPSHKYKALEGFSYARLQTLAASLDNLDLFSDAHDALATTLFGNAVALPFDSEGRISLPDDLAAHAGIVDDSVAFVGLGPSFQVWEPRALQAHKLAATKQLQTVQPTLTLKGA